MNYLYNKITIECPDRTNDLVTILNNLSQQCVNQQYYTVHFISDDDNINAIRDLFNNILNNESLKNNYKKSLLDDLSCSVGNNNRRGGSNTPQGSISLYSCLNMFDIFYQVNPSESYVVINNEIITYYKMLSFCFYNKDTKGIF